MEVQDFAFARQEVVLDAEAKHGFEMAAEDGGGDEFGDGGGFVVAALDGVQGVEARLDAMRACARRRRRTTAMSCA